MMRSVAFLLILLAVAPSALAQRGRAKKTAPPKEQAKAASEKQAELAEAATQSRANLIAATKAYKASLEKLVSLQAEDEQRAASLVEKRHTLLDAGIISKRELEESEQALAAAKSKTEGTRKHINEADQLLAEVVAAEQIAKLPAELPGAYHSSVVLIRYTGTGHWALNDIGKVESFFLTKFGRPLPISAFGQTATHNHLGFDHRESVDVAVHPDSAEGRALIDYLRKQGISFLAFRAPLAGSATGAHLHIGRPSHRLSVPF